MTSIAQTIPMDVEQTGMPFPLGLGIVTVILTGGALLFAVAGVQWGANPAAIAPMRLSWSYVQLALTAVIFCFWPIAALRQPVALRNRGELLSQVFAILLGAVPAVVLSAVLSTESVRDVVYLGCAQGTFLLFTLGMLGWRTRVPQPLMALVLCSWVTVIPLVAFVQNEFFPVLSTVWMQYVPLTLIGNLCEGTPSSAPLEWVWAAVGLSGTGVLLFTFAPASRR